MMSFYGVAHEQASKLLDTTKDMSRDQAVKEIALALMKTHVGTKMEAAPYNRLMFLKLAISSCDQEMEKPGEFHDLIKALRDSMADEHKRLVALYYPKKALDPASP